MEHLKIFIELLVKKYDLPEFLANDILITFYLIFFTYFIINFIAKQIKKYFINKIINKDLFPYFTYNDVRNYTKNYITQYYQNISPTDGDEPGVLHAAAAKSKILKEFLNKKLLTTSDYKYFIILADAGMGKTAFSVNLFLKYRAKKYIFKSLKHNIALIPFGYNEFINKINEIEDKNNTILILDAFDEDLVAIKDYKKRMEEILELVKDFRKVIFTCRTQFFPNKFEEPNETNDITFGDENKKFKIHKLYLSAFDNSDIIKYLLKKYKLNFYKIYRAYNIVTKSPKLMFRPMLLTYTEDLINSKLFYKYSFNVYEELINRWIKRESNKPALKNRLNYKEDLLVFSKKLAVNLYENRFKRNGYIIEYNELQRLNTNGSIETTLLFHDQTGRSLLNRNSEGFYKFSHKSILEFLLAQEIFINALFYKNFEFHGMDLAQQFYYDMLANIIASNDVNIEIFSDKNKKTATPKNFFDNIEKITINNLKTENTSFLIGFNNLKKIEIRNKKFVHLYILYIVILFKDNLKLKNTENSVYARTFLSDIRELDIYLIEISNIRKISFLHVMKLLSSNFGIDKYVYEKLIYFTKCSESELSVEVLDDFRNFRKQILGNIYQSPIKNQIFFISQLNNNLKIINKKIDAIF